MKIPTFRKSRFVDDLGNLIPEVQNNLDVFFQQAQLNLSDDGLVVPSRSTGEINNISSPSNNNGRPDGTLWYDSITSQLKVRIDGVVKVVTVT